MIWETTRKPAIYAGLHELKVGKIATIIKCLEKKRRIFCVFYFCLKIPANPHKINALKK